MNPLFRLFATVLILFLTLGCARVLSRKEVCLELISERNNTIRAKDWPNLVRVSERCIESCRGVQNAEDISDSYDIMATAFFEMNHPNDALDSANSCISIYFPNPSCHLKKAEALLLLYRFEEAKISLNIAEKMAKHELSVIDSYIIAFGKKRDLYAYIRADRTIQKKILFSIIFICGILLEALTDRRTRLLTQGDHCDISQPLTLKILSEKPNSS